MKEPEWLTNPMTGECPVPDGHDTEIALRNGRVYRIPDPEHHDWVLIPSVGDIIKYRDWTAFNQQQAKLEESLMEDGTVTPKTKVLVLDEEGSWVRFDLIEAVDQSYLDSPTRIYTSLSDRVWVESEFTPKQLEGMVKWV